MRRLLALIARSDQSASPVPEEGPEFGWPAPGLDLEAKASASGASPTATRLRLQLYTLLAWLLFKTGRRLGDFDPRHYRTITRVNSDHRKFDDGLKMTLDCSERLVAEVESFLLEEWRRGTLVYGTHCQSEALMTCIVPSVTADDHIHFLDGAEGGYARAATAMKALLAEL